MLNYQEYQFTKKPSAGDVESMEPEVKQSRASTRIPKFYDWTPFKQFT